MKPVHTLQALELQGHGRRSGEPIAFRIESFAEHVASEMARMEPIPTNIFGYSMGGYIALYAAAMGWLPQVRLIVTLGTKYAWNAASATKEAEVLDPFRIQQEYPEWAANLGKKHGTAWKSVVTKTAAMMQVLGESPVLMPSMLQKVPCKVVVLLGSKDKMVSQEESKQLAEDLPDGLFRIMEGMPHPLEQVDVALLVKLLGELSDSGLR
jgi:pimeloyl-ACP methyl ester carboxylesterase